MTQKNSSQHGEKWDLRFLKLAKEVASWSKDPSTQVGAVIVSKDRTIRSVGYNGFPRGVSDTESRYADRPIKLEFVAHAELNAVIQSRGCDGDTIYVWPLYTCSECAKAVIQSGIKRVVCLNPIESRWASKYALASTMFKEAGISVTTYTEEFVKEFC